MVEVYSDPVERFGLLCRYVGARSLAGNPDSPQAVVFLTSIIDELVRIKTYYVYYHVI